MGLFIKKNFWYKLIVCICIFLTITNSTGTKRIYAAGEDRDGIGGTLMSPICDLLLGLCDGIMNLLQKSIMGSEATVRLDNTDDGWSFWEIVGAIAAIVVVVVLCVVTFGTFAAFLAAVSPVLIKAALIFGIAYITTGGEIVGVVSAIASTMFSDDIILPTFAIGPEEIFSGRILLFDPNIFSPEEVFVEYRQVDSNGDAVGGLNTTTAIRFKNLVKNPPSGYTYQASGYYYKVMHNGVEEKIYTSTTNTAVEFKEAISGWYYAIRNLMLVLMMLILVYVGIKIIISSVAEEKAKYKQMIGDWCVGFCLILFLHYIMVFSFAVVDRITEMIAFEALGNGSVAVITPGEDGLNENLVEDIKKLEREQGVGAGTYYDSSNDVIKWPTNLMGRFRVEAQGQDGTTAYIGYTIAYMVLVFYTVFFAFTYLKRAVYLMFLSIIAPIVGFTYPIDKMNDGKAQAFNVWLKEYIYNLLIQPFHLILYVIFVSMAFELANSNILYSLVIIGFLIPAEKFLRKMFGFDKASSPGFLGGAAGAALTMSALGSLKKFAAGDKSSAGGKNSNDKDDNKLRTADSSHSTDSLYGDVAAGRDTEPSLLGSGGSDGGRDEERKRLQSEGGVLDEFKEEGYEAYPGLEREQLQREEQAKREDVEAEAEDAQLESEDRLRKDKQAIKEIEQNLSKSSESSSKTENKNGKNIGRMFGKMAIKGAKSAGKYTLKTAGKLALAAAGGMIGLAAGIASGDPSKALQNTTMGIGTGYALGTGVTNRISNGIGNLKAAGIQGEKDYYGSEYSQYLRTRSDAKFMKDKEKREFYKQQLGLSDDEQVSRAMEDAVKYREYGINDDKIIVKAMKANNGDESNRTDKRRIAAAKMAENSKSEKELVANLQRFAKVPGMTEKQVKEMESLVRKINDM